LGLSGDNTTIERRGVMKASTKEITRLLQLQKIDLELLRLHKKLEELPQRELILKLREKKVEVATRVQQITEMLKENEQSMTRINDEDERLATKQKEVQAKIDDAQGDYRSISSLTKDLEGVAKRRSTLEGELKELDEKNDQIKQVQAQIIEAQNAIDTQEKEGIASFQAEGGALKNEIARLEALQAAASEEIESELLASYEKKKARYGGIGISKLDGGACSVCRNSFDEGKLLQLKSEAPLSECPACKRMMVILDA
jgi:predicted  nucleic acid-binding Zn-ribbon protein